ncbi:MAG: radical SAM protein [Anaerolineaceae bacterium]|nr:radical SAM protein [Anaerolineaceae bacterium]
MSKSPVIGSIIEKSGTELIVSTLPLLANSKPLRHTLLQSIQKYILSARTPISTSFTRPPGVIEDRAEFSSAIWYTADRILEHNLSRPVLRSIARNLVSGTVIEGTQKIAISQFHETYGTNPPNFLVLSPGKTCNLHCTGCYANAGENSEKLDWDIFDRIITEAKTLWGIRFLVISGGEPLAYRSEGKGILDAAEKHPDVFFLMYTNGTLVNDEVAKRLAELGNVTPAFSVEGWRDRTDERRGQGVYDKVLDAMGRLRSAGVPFGISLTATRNNIEEIFSDEFIDFFFEKQGALYTWLFHYMPIGRSFTLDLMPTPKQRVWMWKRVWEIIRDRHIFIADFWNHGTLVDGCLAAGRSGGYFYIDWNGAVSPCVFVPYSPVNIREIYASGGNLNDVWSNPFFTDIRKWQENYRKNNGNWLAPCIIRDNYRDLRGMMTQYEPEPTDENAKKALLDPDYARGMESYDLAYKALADPLWQKYYLHPNGQGKSHDRPLPENQV